MCGFDTASVLDVLGGLILNIVALIISYKDFKSNFSDCAPLLRVCAPAIKTGHWIFITL